MREYIVEFYKDISPESYHIEDAAYVLQIKGAHELARFMSIVEELVEEGILSTKDGEYYAYKKGQPPAKELIQGVYKQGRNGYGFVHPVGEENIYIPENAVHTAMHEDVVEVEITSHGGPQRKREGIVRRIVERAHRIIVGTYDLQKKAAFVIPDNDRLGDHVYIPLGAGKDARSGAKVAVKITKWPTATKKAEGVVTDVLGYKGDVGLDISAIMAEYGIPFSFPKEVKQAAELVPQSVTLDEARWDLRHLPMITIDGEDAKDLDDAVSAQPLPNGSIRLGVHIADVSHYVTPHDTIDKEAYQRGTSVYLVDRVVPMLPEELSNGICSLNAGVDRYAVSCVMDITSQGVVTDFTIKPSLIHVDRRCSYHEIYKALEEDIIPDDLQPYMDLVKDLHQVARWLMDMRHRRGALDFDTPEFKIIVDQQGVPTRVVKRERTIAERIIEECMLIANETVSTFLEKKKEGTIFRVHEPPKLEKLENLKFVIAYLGKEIHWPDTVQPRDVQAFLSLIEGTDIESVGQIMTLRAMQQAHYSADNVGHFGLASSSYTHFTSPIRRYPDLIIHRLIKKALGWDETYRNWSFDRSYLVEASAHTSKQEQVATEAERDVDELKKVQYMASYVGEVFEGTVSSITSFGMFVEIDNGIDGLVPLALMHDDHYIYDEQRLLLIGRRTGKTFHLGETVTVTLVKADVEKKQIDFVLGEVNPAQLFRAVKRPSTSHKKRGTAQEKGSYYGRPTSTSGRKKKGKRAKSSKRGGMTSKRKGRR